MNYCELLLHMLLIHALLIYARIQRLIVKEVPLKRIAYFLEEQNIKLISPALRIIGDLCSGSSENVDEVIASQALTSIKKFVVDLRHPTLLRESCWIFSNIAAGPVRHVGILIDMDIIKQMIALVLDHEDFQIKLNAGWTVANACAMASESQTHCAVSQGAIQCLLNILLLKK